MSLYFTTMTRKGQITIPADIRRDWGLQEGDRIEVRREGGQARIAPAGDVVARTAGVFRQYAEAVGPPLTAEELDEAIETAIAEDVVERMRR